MRFSQTVLPPRSTPSPQAAARSLAQACPTLPQALSSLRHTHLVCGASAAAAAAAVPTSHSLPQAKPQRPCGPQLSSHSSSRVTNLCYCGGLSSLICIHRCQCRFPSPQRPCSPQSQSLRRSRFPATCNCGGISSLICTGHHQGRFPLRLPPKPRSNRFPHPPHAHGPECRKGESDTAISCSGAHEMKDFKIKAFVRGA